MDSHDGGVPEHVHEAVRASVQMHAKHRSAVTPLTAMINGLTGHLGHPFTVSLYLVISASWGMINEILLWRGLPAFDKPPFAIFASLTSFVAVFLTLLILTTQQHEYSLSETRAQTTLELALLSEKKLAMMLEMLDTQLRILQNGQTPHDPNIEALSTPRSAEDILFAIEESRRIQDSNLADGR